MMSYKRDVLERQSLSEVKMGRGSQICERVCKKIMEYSWKHSSFERRPFHPPPQTLGIRPINPDHVWGSIPPRGRTEAHQNLWPPKSVQPLSTGWCSAIPIQDYDNGMHLYGGGGNVFVPRTHYSSSSPTKLAKNNQDPHGPPTTPQPCPPSLGI